MNDIKYSLFHTIYWCNKKFDWNSLQSCHRSLELFPYQVMSIEESKITYFTFDQLRELVDYIIEKRRDLSKHEFVYERLKGRILSFYPELSLNDSMVADECQRQMNLIRPDCKGEYIDDYDIPPWDTWISCDLKGDLIVLYTWIHPELVDFISKAIAVDAYNCFAWAEALEKELGMTV
ncbi:hypothetical protein [Acinetobacter gyllenbergii]|uniref:hypothetical protein n=1 Tax=Acinetobacter gyllenbergii TaxID=134534 RepID=UPI003F5647E0